MKTRRCISFFDLTGNMLRPWLDAGYECWLVDIQHPEGRNRRDDGMMTLNLDLSKPMEMRQGFVDSLAFVSAFPPCDHLAVSGSRWFQGKGLRKLASSIEMFATAAELCEQSGAPYMIENPVSTISSYWRKPDHSFHPHQYTQFEPNDNYTKKTCLWTGGGFVMPAPFKLEGQGPPDSRIHFAAPGKNRKNFRSATPMGFARAVFAANNRTVL